MTEANLSLPKKTGNVLVFKTNISTQGELLKVRTVLDNLEGIVKWNLDQQDVDNVLRIETEHISVNRILLILQQAGFYGEELPD